MGVPEFWRFNGSVLTFYQLEQDHYQEVEMSPTFPWVSKDVFYHFFKQGKKIGEAQALRELKTWVQENSGSSA